MTDKENITRLLGNVGKSVLGWGGGEVAHEHIKEGFTEEVTSECRRLWNRQGQVFQAAGTLCAKTFHLSATSGHCESEKAVLFLVIMPRK